jgi:cupin fold WbuC family metalloprotein
LNGVNGKMQGAAPSTTILHSTDEVATIDATMIRRMHDLALKSPDGRARLCLHHSESDPAQEMIMALTSDNCYPVHRHRDKAESYHILEGTLGIAIFDDDGRVRRRAVLSATANDAGQVLRIAPMLWHAVLPLSLVVIFHEVTAGPFRPGQSEFAAFCPEDIEQRRAFFRKVTDGMMP